MAKEVFMPKFGFTQEASQIVAWLASEGDAVEAGEPLLEVTTDKVNMEVEAPASGILAGISAVAGDTVPVTTVIAYILAPGEELPERPRAASHPARARAPVVAHQATSAATAPAVSATPVAARRAAAAGVALEQVTGSGAGGRITRGDVEAYLEHSTRGEGKVRATPAARRVARQQRVDLAAVAGTGPNGRIQEADVHLAAEQPTAVTSPASAPVEATRIPFTNMRRTIARTMQRSMQEAPHITFQSDVDMTALLELVELANERATGGVKVSLTAALAKAVAWALERHPLLNSRLGDDEIILQPAINLGIAVALDDGLIVPVVAAASHKSISRLAAAIADLSRRAREGKLRPEELSDSTFTISNLGMFGIDRFTAIINPPEVAILAIGGITRRFVPDENDQPVARPVCTLTLSVDHRVIDGAVAARFMADLRAAVERPQLMVV